ncbi:MAG: hypothetical protein N3A54_01940, partial [Patescibacteria group bacterium]|nr:hypothetical protein [Patescibacteria group bacterium]
LFHLLNKNLIILCFILLLIGLFFTSGSHPPTGDIYVLLMKKIPGFAIFRSSFFKFAPVLWFSIILLSGYFLQIFFEKHKKFYIGKLVIIVVILLYHFPFFSTNFFNFSKDFTTRLKIPSYVYKTREYLMKDASIGRILIVPELDRGFINRPIDTYAWGYYSLDALPRIISDKSFLANDSPYEIVQALYTDLYNGDKEKFLGLAKALGVTHMLYRNDVKSSNTARKISQEKIQEIAEEVTFQEGEWSVYSLGINPISSYASDAIFSLVSVNHPSFFVASYSGVIQTDWNTAKNIGSSMIALQGECFYCEEGEYEAFISSIQIPTSRYKKIVSTDIDALLSSSLFSLREYIKTKSDEILKEYASIVETIDRQVSSLDGRAKDYYNARVLGFLLKQQELGDEKIDQILSPIITSYMATVWKSDATMYRFGTTIPEDMTYLIQSTDGFFSERKFFTKGYYRFEIPKKSQKDIPKLFFVTKREQSNPSKKLFVFPYSYDHRWTFDGIHVMANGYANGWIMDGYRDTSQVMPAYTPHRIFLFGVVISAGSLFGFMIFFLKKYFLK